MRFRLGLVSSKHSGQQLERMRPTLSMNDSTYGALVNSKDRRDSCLAPSLGTFCPGIFDIVRCERVHTMSLSDRALESFSGFSIVHIVLVRSSVQMDRIAARPVVAVVQNKLFIRNRSVGSKIGEPVRRNVFAIPFESAVPVWRYESLPRPTTCRRSNHHMAPKTGLNKVDALHRHTVMKGGSFA